MRTRIAICLSAALLIAGAAITAWTDVPTSMNVQGQLTDSGGSPVTADTMTFVFSIYDVAVDGNPLWGPETQVVEVKAAGLWNAHVGAVIALTPAVFQDTARWLEVTVRGESLSPRIKLNTNPFSYRAASSQYADSARPDSDWEYSGNNIFRLSGNVGIGTNNPLYDLDVADDVRIEGTLTDYGSVYIIDPGDGIIAGYRLRVHGKAYAESLVVGMYNSGWQPISEGDTLTLPHNLHGDASKYIVIVDGKSSSGSIHQANFGTSPISFILYQWIGLEWFALTSTSIKLERGNADDRGSDKDWDYVRVRIIKNQ